MWARIDTGIAREIIDFDPAGKFHTSIVWVICDDSVESGYLYSDGQFSQPPIVVINHTIASKLSVMRYLENSIIDGVAEWDAVEALFDANSKTERYWNAASELHIDDIKILEMAQVLNWDAAKIQLIFNEAAEL
jgi:hypothetical protein